MSDFELLIFTVFPLHLCILFHQPHPAWVISSGSVLDSFLIIKTFDLPLSLHNNESHWRICCLAGHEAAIMGCLVCNMIPAAFSEQDHLLVRKNNGGPMRASRSTRVQSQIRGDWNTGHHWQPSLIYCRVLTGVDHKDHIIPILASFNWLPIKSRTGVFHPYVAALRGLGK